MEGLKTVTHAAQETGISRRTLYWRAEHHTIPSCVIDGVIFIPTDTVEALKGASAMGLTEKDPLREALGPAGGTREPKWIYVCSAYQGRLENLERGRRYARAIWEEGHIPVVPHVWFGPYAKEHVSAERMRRREAGVRLLDTCDCMRVYLGVEGITEGMQAEIELAQEKGLPIVYTGRESGL